MRRRNQCLTSVLLSAALMMPVGALAMVSPQDDHERHEQEERERRVYDPVYKDYHNWDAKEDEAYRHWLETKHEAYVEYEKLAHKRQEEYWKWRHEHEEHQEHENR
jgi:hypothetical protein